MLHTRCTKTEEKRPGGHGNKWCLDFRNCQYMTHPKKAHCNALNRGKNMPLLAMCHTLKGHCRKIAKGRYHYFTQGPCRYFL